MFKLISQWKIWGVVALAFTTLLMVISRKNSKIDKLEHKEKINEIIKVNHEEQDKDEAEAINNEQVKIQEEIQVRSKFSRADRFNKL
jgi:low affinity Fe/Cu permease